MAFVVDPSLLGLENEVALVTGGAAGIGKGGAVQLARAGCHIAIVDIDEEVAGRTVKEIQRLGREAAFIPTNVRKAEQVQKMVQKVIEVFGKLHIAVNNVGGPLISLYGRRHFLDYTEAVWDDIIEQNLKSTFLCCQAEALAMIEYDIPGRIINVASSSGVVGAPAGGGT